MNLKTFQAESMAAALAKVKEQFGAQALILHTKTVKRRGLAGCSGKQIVEIIAARDGFSLPTPPARGRLAKCSRSTGVVDGATRSMPDTDTSSAAIMDALATLVGEVGALKSALGDSNRPPRSDLTPSLPQPLHQVYQDLIQAQVAEEIAQQLVRRVRAELGDDALSQPDAVRERLAAAIESLLPTAPPVNLTAGAEQTIIAVVGPTGVGKTTTIAKLAANYSLRQGRTVGLITVDTYRIAAVDQLQTYARIIDVPLQVVLTPDQMRAAVESMRDRDVILIDTVGRSPNDQARLADLKAMLDEARPHQVHLALSSTAARDVLHQSIERFGVLGVNRLIFTKLDEAVGFGAILSCMQMTEARLSYVTTGQDVPDDIEFGYSPRLARLIAAGPGAGRLFRRQAIDRSGNGIKADDA